MRIIANIKTIFANIILSFATICIKRKASQNKPVSRILCQNCPKRSEVTILSTRRSSKSGGGSAFIPLSGTTADSQFCSCSLPLTNKIGAIINLDPALLRDSSGTAIPLSGMATTLHSGKDLAVSFPLSYPYGGTKPTSLGWGFRVKLSPRGVSARTYTNA